MGELRVVANNLKSLEVSEEKANQREEAYKEQIKTLTAKLKQAEARAEFAEKSVQKLQKEVDRLEDELVHEMEKFKAISDELDQTFAEMSGYQFVNHFTTLQTRNPFSSVYKPLPPSNGTNKFRQRAVHIAGHSLVSEKKNQYINTQFQFEAIERWLQDILCSVSLS